jgi:hypothetical protein
MKDQLTTFETAKLAKEKGFDWDVLHSYRDGLLDLDDNYTGVISEMYFNANGKNRTKFKEILSAPTQSLLQKWLREKYDAKVEVRVELGIAYISRVYWNVDIRASSISTPTKTYEEALEKGLQEALKLIK